MLCSAPMATAAPQAPNDDIQSIKISSQKADSAIDYWTADRMKAAKNADSLVKGKSGSAAKVESGKSAKVPGHAAKANAGVLKSATAGKTRASAESPVSHIGKVFFTLGGSGGLAGLEAEFASYQWPEILAILLPSIELASGVFLLLV